MERQFWGKTKNNEDVELFTLINSNGCKAQITNFGATLVSLFVKDRNGELVDVVLGYDDLAGYEKKRPFHGATIGRHANRIEDAKFTINGKEYLLATNDGKNHLHGGSVGFDKKVWAAVPQVKDGNESLKLKYISPDGEENYPGNLEVEVTYTLTNNDELVIDYKAVSDKDTVINLTNHAYFNLGGHDSGDVLDHELMIDADFFTPASKDSIPTGEVRFVDGTPMDFRNKTKIGARIDNDFDQLNYAGGYDHNWVLKVSGEEPVKVAEAFCEKTGVSMETYTTKPGIQLYTGNYLEASDIGKNGKGYMKRGGLCLETQYFPNSTKHSHFPSPIFKAGQLYKHTTIYKFV